MPKQITLQNVEATGLVIIRTPGTGELRVQFSYYIADSAGSPVYTFTEEATDDLTLAQKLAITNAMTALATKKAQKHGV